MFHAEAWQFGTQAPNLSGLHRYWCTLQIGLRRSARRTNGVKLKKGKCRLNAGEMVLTARYTGLWNRLLRTLDKAPSHESFKTGMDKTIPNRAIESHEVLSPEMVQECRSRPMPRKTICWKTKRGKITLWLKYKTDSQENCFLLKDF